MLIWCSRAAIAAWIHNDITWRWRPISACVVGPAAWGKTSFWPDQWTWPAAAGEIRRPPIAELLFIPRSPIYPRQASRTALLPTGTWAFSSDSHLRSVLERSACPTGAALSRSRIKPDWQRILSLVSTAVAFAACLLNLHCASWCARRAHQRTGCTNRSTSTPCSPSGRSPLLMWVTCPNTRASTHRSLSSMANGGWRKILCRTMTSQR